MPPDLKPFDGWGEDRPAADADYPTRPADSRIGSGYASDEGITAAHFNWLADMVGQLTQAAMPYTDLGSLVDDLSAGMHAPCSEDTTGAGQPGTPRVTVASGLGPGKIVTNGHQVAWFNGISDARVDDRLLSESGSGGSPTLLAPTTTATSGAYSIACSDTYVALLYNTAGGSYVELFTWAGVSQWNKLLGNSATGYDLAVDADQVYVVSSATSSGGGGTNQCTAYAIADGTIDWEYDHGATLYSVCVADGRLFVAGSAGTGTSTLRCLVASSGDDDSSDIYRAWSASPTAVTGPKLLATDGQHVYAAYPGGGSDELAVYGAGDGVLVLSRDLLDLAAGVATAVGLSVDQSMVFVAIDDTTDGEVQAFDKRTLAQAWRYSDGDSASTYRRITSVASDGQAVFIFGQDGGTDKSLVRLYRGQAGPTQYLIPASGASFLRYPHLSAQPMD